MRETLGNRLSVFMVDLSPFMLSEFEIIVTSVFLRTNKTSICLSPCDRRGFLYRSVKLARLNQSRIAA